MRLSGYGCIMKARFFSKAKPNGAIHWVLFYKHKIFACSKFAAREITEATLNGDRRELFIATKKRQKTNEYSAGFYIHKVVLSFNNKFFKGLKKAKNSTALLSTWAAKKGNQQELSASRKTMSKALRKWRPTASPRLFCPAKKKLSPAAANI